MGCGKPCGQKSVVTGQDGNVSSRALNGHGPGSKLIELMPVTAKVWAWLSRKDCGCYAYAAQMDAWGPSGCERRREAIIERLLSKAPPAVAATSLAQHKAASLVDEAIEKAREADPATCYCGRSKPAAEPSCKWCANKHRLSSQ